MSDASNKPVIFLAFANDRDDTVGYLRNLPEEARQIRDPLLRASRDGLCELVELANATADDIFRVFQDPDYRDRIAVFHYGGHANGYQLLLESADGSSQAAEAGGLAAFFGQQRGLELVFLNGCSTQQQVQGLLDANISAVIATSRAIDDHVAMQFSKLFYQGLAGGANLRTAYNEAEASVQTTKGGDTRTLYFSESDQQAEQTDSHGRWPWEFYVADGADGVANWNLPDAVGDPLFGLPDVTPRDLPESPYRNLNYFTREDAEVFFGRGHQIRELYDLVVSPGTAPIVLLYGQSGVGKSSMLAAGLIPRLEQTCEVRYLRRDQNTGLLGTLHGMFYDSGTSVSVSGSMHFANDWQELEDELGKPLVIIIDQVEEVVTRPNPDLPHESEDFLNELESIFGNRQQRPEGRLILGFRKEWLAEVEARLAERKLPRARVFLERLGRLGVIEAVRGPTRSRRLKDHYRLSVEDGLPEIIADDLLSDAASAIAPTLQILLTKMWAKALEENYEHPHFSLKSYHHLKREGLLLRDFLDQQIEKFRERYADAVNSGLLMDILAVHTTALGTADQCSVAELEPAYSGLGHELSDLLQQCQDLYLLTTMTGERRDAIQTTRLSHDTLAPLVRERFDEADAPGQRALRVLKNRVRGWKDGETGQPLDEIDLKIVEAGYTGMRHWTPDEQRLVDASRKSRARKKTGKRLLQLAGLAAIGMIVVAAAIAVWQARVARHNTVTAHFMVAGADSEQGNPAEALYWFWRAYGDASRNSDRKLNARNLIASWSRSLGTQFRHDDTVMAACFSPDNKLVFTGSFDGTARLWDMATGSPKGEPLQHETAVNTVGFSPNGERLLTVTDDQTVQCWDAATQQPTGAPLERGATVTAINFSQDSQTVLIGHRGGNVLRWDPATGNSSPIKLNSNESLTHLAFSVDGSLVLTTNIYDEAQLWDLKTGDSIGQPLKHNSPITGATFSADGKQVLTGCNDKTVRLWDVEQGSLIGRPIRYSETIVSFAFSPDQSLVLTGSSDNTARLWSTKTQSIIGEPMRHEGTVADVVFSSDGKKILTASWDNTARLWDTFDPQGWDATSGDARGAPLEYRGAVTSVAFSPDGETVLIGSEDKSARLWSTSTGEPKDAPLSHDGEVFAVAFSHDGKSLLTGGYDGRGGEARLWDAATGKLRGEPMLHGKAVLSVAFSLDDKMVLTGSEDFTARLWDAGTGKPKGEEFIHKDAVNFVTFSPDGKLVLTCSNDETARLWDVATGKPHGSPLVHKQAVNSGEFSPDGLTVITASDDNSARMWNVETCEPHGPVLQHNEPVNDAAFSPDGKFTITSSDDNTARLWNAETGEPRGEPMRHRGPVNAASVSPDSQTVITVSNDNTARLWDALTGQPRGEPLRHADAVTAVAFGPNGQTVITGSQDKTARLWNVPPSAEDDPARLKLSVEVRTGYYTDKSGIRHALDQTEWLDRKRQLDDLGGPCGIRRWEELTDAELKSSLPPQPSK